MPTSPGTGERGVGTLTVVRLPDNQQKSPVKSQKLLATKVVANGCGPPVTFPTKQSTTPTQTTPFFGREKTVPVVKKPEAAKGASPFEGGWIRRDESRRVVLPTSKRIAIALIIAAHIVFLALYILLVARSLRAGDE